MNTQTLLDHLSKVENLAFMLLELDFTVQRRFREIGIPSNQQWETTVGPACIIRRESGMWLDLGKAMILVEHLPLMQVNVIAHIGALVSVANTLDREGVKTIADNAINELATLLLS